MARDGWLFVGPSLGVCVLGLFGVAVDWQWSWFVLIEGFTVAVCFAFFFRDPNRTTPAESDVIVATADGRIVVVDARDDGSTQIDTFLSVLDVHVNRAPVSGTIRDSVYRPGRFHVAFRSEAADNNERHDLLINGPHGTIMSAQIAGILARRIVCRPRPGDRLQMGERIGLIRFGSRTQIIAPSGYVASVSVGDRVRAGETVIARWSSTERTNA